MSERRAIDWSLASWLNPPPQAKRRDHSLWVTTGERTDFWRTTSYGFVHDDGHALMTALPDGTAAEVAFLPDHFDALYDQAGVMVRVGEGTWIKTGIEMTDGVPHLGAVVTRVVSDWSMAPVPLWERRLITVRASRSGDAVTIRARCEGEPWRMVRLGPLERNAHALAGPFCCSPQRAGLQLYFTELAIGPADTSLHTSP
ncbi:DUF1349 domain-containing protein [Streptomyces sp. RP5T]|uniref:DUF1349 domain-containing protein n=1 Tax=Streptomyces sp. RP5T TaxID=2490848 RepID=UPI000F645980|nr:DUF1349 domain-containing protein [Streptomyces sp. RP5T]RRR86082.1 DUF1349 domain-containing protein [Streptomyces sp. RP5T]